MIYNTAVFNIFIVVVVKTLTYIFHSADESRINSFTNVEVSITNSYFRF